MSPEKIDKKTIIKRIDIIQDSLVYLQELKKLSPGKFMLDRNFALAEHFLRYALEATFDICGHILSKIPGAQVGEYKQMAREMGRQGIVPLDFAEQALEKMAGYRNRLTHFYFEVSPKEMYDIIRNNLRDFEQFLGYIKEFLKKHE